MVDDDEEENYGNGLIGQKRPFNINIGEEDP